MNKLSFLGVVRLFVATVHIKVVFSLTRTILHFKNNSKSISKSLFYKIQNDYNEKSRAPISAPCAL